VSTVILRLLDRIESLPQAALLPPLKKGDRGGFWDDKSSEQLGKSPLALFVKEGNSFRLKKSDDIPPVWRSNYRLFGCHAASVAAVDQSLPQI
jgi:hypothetical protein